MSDPLHNRSTAFYEERIDQLEAQLKAANAECQRAFVREENARAELRRREERKANKSIHRIPSAQIAWDELRQQLEAERKKFQLLSAQHGRLCDEVYEDDGETLKIEAERKAKEEMIRRYMAVCEELATERKMREEAERNLGQQQILTMFNKGEAEKQYQRAEAAEKDAHRWHQYIETGYPKPAASIHSNGKPRQWLQMINGKLWQFETLDEAFAVLDAMKEKNE